MRPALKIAFWPVLGLLAASLVATICGSAFNLTWLLDAGTAGWLAACFLLFSWLVLRIWSGSRKYDA